MQPHAEGSPLLPLQMGFNARAAVTAADLAAAGLPAPTGFLEGRYGYFNLMETHWDPARVPGTVKEPHRINELSHKPFPTGRATHAAIDALAQLKQAHGFRADEVAEVVVAGPPLVLQLADRVPSADMSANYARLCLPYVLATALTTDGVAVEDFDADAIRDSARQAVARRVSVQHDGSSDDNALAPVRVTVRLANGAAHSEQVDHILGHPSKPLSEDQYLAKFRRCCQSALRPPDPMKVDALIAACDQLGALPDARVLMDQMAG
jgi:2-methylcitrate dehydratase PrpD